FSGIMYLLGGGLFYTIGLVFYKLKDVRYMHSIWHLFVLIGAILQYVAVAYYVLPITF
ncbi:MAG: hemolysin III family protein, partial [Clostridia bacterium]|nr:hemolysin III family protein [Clostridia bacterium]